MKLHRDIGVSQATTWFMLQRVREAFGTERPYSFNGPIEIDEAYFGGLEKNKHASKKANLGRGPVGKPAVVGMKDRETNSVKARVVSGTDKPTLQGFVREHADDHTKVYRTIPASTRALRTTRASSTVSASTSMGRRPRTA